LRPDLSDRLITASEVGAAEMDFCRDDETHDIDDNRWLAERLLMGKPSSIGAFVRQFRLEGGQETKQLKAVVSGLMT
jgi:hypothetical protein